MQVLMACSSNICVKGMVGTKGYHCLDGYLATYSQKTNSHLCDCLDTPYEDNLSGRKRKKKKKREEIVSLVIILGGCQGERPEI